MNNEVTVSYRFSLNRYSEDRVPTEAERRSVRARMIEYYIDKNTGESKTRTFTFAQAWKRYMVDEQEVLNKILKKEKKAIEEDKVKIYNLDKVIETIVSIQSLFKCTAMRALCTYLNEIDDRKKNVETSTDAISTNT